MAFPILISLPGFWEQLNFSFFPPGGEGRGDGTPLFVPTCGTFTTIAVEATTSFCLLSEQHSSELKPVSQVVGSRKSAF
jgi:hypothetical protein